MLEQRNDAFNNKTRLNNQTTKLRQQNLLLENCVDVDSCQSDLEHTPSGDELATMMLIKYSEATKELP